MIYFDLPAQDENLALTLRFFFMSMGVNLQWNTKSNILKGTIYCSKKSKQ